MNKQNFKYLIKECILEVIKESQSGPSFILTPKKDRTQGISEKINHLGEREYNTYRGWVAAVKKVDPQAKFTGDKDISGAETSNGKYLGEWDGAVGSVAVKSPISSPQSDMQIEIAHHPKKPGDKSIKTTWSQFMKDNVDGFSKEDFDALKSEIEDKGFITVGGGAASAFIISKVGEKSQLQEVEVRESKRDVKSMNLSEKEKIMLARLVSHFSKNPSISAKNIDGIDFGQAQKFVDMGVDKIKSPEQKTLILALQNKFNVPVNESEEAPKPEPAAPQQSEMERTKNDFEAGKVVRKLEKPITVKVKDLIQFKTKSTGIVTQIQPNTQIDVFCGSSGIYTFLQEKKTWAKINYVNGSKYFSKFKPQPSMNSLEKMSNDGVATTPLGSRVEPDGTGPYGDPSWLLIIGVI